MKGEGVGYFSLCTVYGHPVTSSQLTSLCVVAQGHPVTSSQLPSVCVVAQGHPVTSSQMTSVCAVAQGHPVTSSQMTSSICQGQSRSGHYWVLHRGLVWIYISSISQEGGLLFQAEQRGTAGVVLVHFGVTDCAWEGMCTVGVFCRVWGIAAG